MIFDDAWSEGLTQKQQNCILDYFQNGCEVYSGMGGYKSKSMVIRFINSKKGRNAVRMFGEFLLDLKRDTVKFQLIKIYANRAFYKPSDIINADGALVVDDLKKLGDLAYCVEGIEKRKTAYGTDVKIKLCDRHKSMEALERIFDILNKDIEDDTGQRSVYEMTDEERDLEIKYYLEKGGLNGNGK